MEIPVDCWGDRPGDYVPPGGWLRTAWNFCWKHGLTQPFPHSAETLDGLRRGLLAHLRERGAPAYKLEALADWGVDQYHSKRQRRARPKPSYEERTRMLGRPPIRPRPYLLIPELPPMMRPPNIRGRFRPLVQYCKDWAVQPANRGKMMADRPPPDTEPAMAASIAAVVHALCDLDELTPEEWVFEYRSPQPERIWGLDDMPINPNKKYDRRMIAEAPAACAYHNVFFADTFIEGPLWINPPVDNPVSPERIPPRYRKNAVPA